MKNTRAPQITTLIKFLDKKYVASVLGGSLRLGAVAIYRKDYKEELGLRSDSDECISFRLAAGSNVIIKYEGQPVGRIDKGITDSLSYENRSYIFSMSAVTDYLFEAPTQNNKWCFDRRVRELGDKAILVSNPSEFVRRLAVAAQAKSFLLAHPDTGGQASRLVEYIDVNKYNGDVGPFRKSIEYEFQKEWRLALIDARDEVTNSPDCHFLELGDISDIAFAVDTDALIERGFTCELA